jgi:hypothetical protein
VYRVEVLLKRYKENYIEPLKQAPLKVKEKYIEAQKKYSQWSPPPSTVAAAARFSSTACSEESYQG